MKWWSFTALPWLKKNWRWLVLPVGIALFLAGYLIRKKPKVLAPEMVGASEVERNATDDAAAAVAAAVKEKDERLAEIEKEHAATLEKLTDGQRAKVKELHEDPEKLNDFLLHIGRDIRG
jgi:hypothetical protein